MNLQEAISKILAEAPSRLVLSSPRSQNSSYIRSEITLKQGKTIFYQQANRTRTQVFHENYAPEELPQRLEDLLTQGYTQLNAWSSAHEYALRVSKKGKVLLQETLSKGAVMTTLNHNRPKKRLLTEGEIIPPLIDMGIFTREGRLIPSMSDKYRQINRFVEMVDDVLRDRTDSHYKIIDFGCGKSYLTFILYYYFTQIRGLQVDMLGLDLKKDVIEHCNEAAHRYGYDHLRFQVGDIHGFAMEPDVDMVITLHACDTATDFALRNAVGCGASIILSVPCCQHELNRQMQSDTFSLLTHYGIIQERTAALMTDAIRANYLITQGYRTQLLEFVDMEHTPKNLLIRAVKAPIPETVKKNAQDEIDRLCAEFHLQPTILS